MKDAEVKETFEPEDLMTLNELCEKHHFKYDYLYKCSVTKGYLQVYYRGNWNLSESEVLEFSRKSAEKKLSKLRAKEM